jgi:hypothetical protein
MSSTIFLAALVLLTSAPEVSSAPERLPRAVLVRAATETDHSLQIAPRPFRSQPPAAWGSPELTRPDLYDYRYITW